MEIDWKLILLCVSSARKIVQKTISIYIVFFVE